MCHIYRRTFDIKTGEYRRGEYVGYVDTSRYAGLFSALSGIEALNAHAGPPEATAKAKPAKPRLRLVADLQEFRAWRRYQRAYTGAQTYDHFGLDG